MLLRLLSVAALASALTVEPVEEKPVKLKMIEGFSFADPPQDCHYADPWKQACKSDELAAEIPAQPQSLKICVSKCSADSDCPTDVWYALTLPRPRVARTPQSRRNGRRCAGVGGGTADGHRRLGERARGGAGSGSQRGGGGRGGRAAERAIRVHACPAP